MVAIRTVSSSGNASIDGLLSGEAWTSGQLTYGFPSSAAAYGAGYGAGEAASGFQPLSALAQASVSRILASYAEVARLTFTQAFGDAAAGATLLYAMSAVPETAYAYLPEAGSAGGDAWFQSAGARFADPQPGSYGGFALVHEIGHTLGLKHPHETGAFGTVPTPYDSIEYTVMSYRSYVGASAYAAEDGNYPTGPMALDIAALQHLYGANYETRAGDTVYRWDLATGERFVDGASQGPGTGSPVFETIWDGGGQDTYDLSNATAAAEIDLTPGGWSSFAKVSQLHFDGSHPARGNVANALQVGGDARSLIENAVGGAGDDAIFGNAADNRLEGGGGNDLISGAAGADRLLGHTGDDTLSGGAGNDTFWGGAGSDDLRGGAGDDVMYGGFGNDTLTGGEGDDALRGQADDDLLAGGAGNDMLMGEDGNDTLSGGAGDDRLVGGAGNDVFVFTRDGASSDKIADFGDVAGNEDRIDLSAVFGRVTNAMFAGWAADHLDQRHANVLIETGEGGSIWLLGIDVSQLDASDFVFA
ncbi:M10 family metallopeptidase C-terminal domain-containing protein [Aureimonas pseudogalii]|uniref:Serralysin n=1 Tax=Aureimonas pseudogalii TaxID=1744844 RepID=A0A7W6H474_9HYPH|nr:M10 family metallopeptidase C-terminal domain-containing protein [Aureimonas pseudogalii]MBB3997892.1 serralysin [Aureimonas pseudogalii]